MGYFKKFIDFFAKKIDFLKLCWSYTQSSREESKDKKAPIKVDIDLKGVTVDIPSLLQSEDLKIQLNMLRKEVAE